MMNFRQIFEDYGGDYEQTMGRFLGKESVYLKMLAMLPNDSSMEKLGIALNDGDYHAAFEAAHTLKGIAGNLGLTPLYKAVNVIVELLRVGEPRDDYPVLYQSVKIEYQRTEALYAQLEGWDYPC